MVTFRSQYSLLMSDFSVILGYHKVGPVGEEGKWLNVEPEDLRKQIRFLRRRGFEFFQAHEYVNQPIGKGACLTFDDGYQSFLTYGVEVLAAEKTKSSVYIVPSQVGNCSAWDGDKAGPLGDWDLIKIAESQGVEIGNHTMTHRPLGDLARSEQLHEIRKAQSALLEKGYKPTSFCMPYGSFNAETESVLTEVGLGVGLTIKKGFVRRNDNRLLLNRVMVSYSDRVPGLWYKLFLKPVLNQLRGRA